MASFIAVFLLMGYSIWTAAGSARCPGWVHLDLKLLLPPPLLLLSSRTRPQPSSLPLLVLPSTVASPSPSLWVLCQRLFCPNRRTPEQYALYLQYLLYHLSRDVHPVCCSSPLPGPLLFSPKSPSSLLLILASKSLSSSFSTWLSSVMPLYLPGSCTSSVIFHIGTIRPILHSFCILPSCIHTFSSLPVLTLDYQKYTPFCSRCDLQMTRIVVSKITESLYEWRRVDMHATPYFKHANIFGYIKYIGPPLFLKPGSAPESYCTNLYGSHLWHIYTKAQLNKLRITYTIML